MVETLYLETLYLETLYLETLYLETLYLETLYLETLYLETNGIVIVVIRLTSKICIILLSYLKTSLRINNVFGNLFLRVTVDKIFILEKGKLN